MAAEADALPQTFAGQEATRLALAATGVVVWEWTLGEIATNALQFYRPQTAPTQVNVCALLDSVLLLLEPRLRAARIVVEKDYRPTRPVLATDSELRQVFANLLNNACDALTHQQPSANPRLILRVRERQAAGNAEVHVMFADCGIGMSAENRRHLFEPFFSTKETNGTGLGLWISGEIVKKHHGRIRVKSRPGGGSAFRVGLPVSMSSAGSNYAEQIPQA